MHRFLARYMCALSLTALAFAQAPADQTAPAPAPAANTFSAGPIDFSGLIDTYYSLNFNHPATRNNNLRNFDVKANQFNLNYAELVAEHAPDPIGFRVDFGFGKTADLVNSVDPAGDTFRYIQQAYVSLKPASAKGFQFDVGKFVTNAGAEVIETHSNWNYSRSLLFSWAIPYYHFGARASAPLGSHFTAGASVLNGWNNVQDNNAAKTFGLSGTFTHGKVSWANNYYVGGEKTDINKGLRHLYDTTLYLNPTTKTNFYINFDYATEKAIGGGSSDWIGVAGAARFALNEWFAVAPRIEWFYDKDGFATGTAQKLKEFTLTGEFRMKEGFLTRLEYRRDWSDQPFFDRGNEPGSYKNQDTLLAGFVVFFGPRR
jgi:Putative beta-barrel porin-2, OmpL-like. bbp2